MSFNMVGQGLVGLLERHDVRESPAYVRMALSSRKIKFDETKNTIRNIFLIEQKNAHDRDRE